VVSIVVFVLMRLLPGDPIHDLIEREIQNRMQSGVAMTIEQQQALRDSLEEKYGLNKPMPLQYLDWLGQMVRGDFGTSIARGYDVVDEIGPRMVVSIYLAILSMIVTLFFGVLFGTIAAVRNGKFIDNLVTTLSNIGMTVPGFLIAIVLVYIFGFVLEWLPIWGFELPWKGHFGLSLRQTVLPVLTMSLGGIGGLARMTRSAMLDVLNADYVRTAWAKGMREKVVILRHVFKNGLMPIVSGVGGMIRGLFGGSVIIETIFVVPGVGQLMVTATLALDYPVVQAVTVLMTFITVISNLITDVLYGWVDPRIQYS
jgi:peptide/nickel transport system permease protein